MTDFSDAYLTVGGEKIAKVSDVSLLAERTEPLLSEHGSGWIVREQAHARKHL